MVRQENIDKALAMMAKAMALLSPEETQQPAKNPEWYRDTGHLTDKGIAHIENMFAEGKTPYAAAQEMGMSYRAAAERRKTWLKKNSQ